MTNKTLPAPSCCVYFSAYRPGAAAASPTLKAPGSQLGNSELRMPRVACCTCAASAKLLFSFRVRSMMASYLQQQ
jgi:hypothetical protein